MPKPLSTFVVIALLLASACSLEGDTKAIDGADIDASVREKLLELEALRSQYQALEAGSGQYPPCPTGIENLVGVPSSEIIAVMGQPWHEDTLDGERTWVYEFTSPVPKGQRGGGFPELVLKLNDDGAISEASCHYAR